MVKTGLAVSGKTLRLRPIAVRVQHQPVFPHRGEESIPPEKLRWE